MKRGAAPTSLSVGAVAMKKRKWWRGAWVACGEVVAASLSMGALAGQDQRDAREGEFVLVCAAASSL